MKHLIQLPIYIQMFLRLEFSVQCVLVHVTCFNKHSFSGWKKLQSKSPHNTPLTLVSLFVSFAWFSIYSLFFPTDSVSTLASVSIASRLKRTCLWLCGLEKPDKNGIPAPPPPPDPTINSLEEDRCMKGVMDANLIVCLSVAIFLIAYWAWWDSLLKTDQ